MSEGLPKVSKEDEVSFAEAMDGRFENQEAVELTPEVESQTAEKFAVKDPVPAPEAAIEEVRGRLDQQKPVAEALQTPAAEHGTNQESAVHEAKNLLDSITTRDKQGVNHDFDHAKTPEEIMKVIDDARYKEDRVLADRKRDITAGTFLGGASIMTGGIFLGSAAIASTGIGAALLAAPAAYLYLRRRYAKRQEKHMTDSINLRKKFGLSSSAR